MRFGREHRLTDRPDFLHCYDAGRRFFSSGFVLFAAQREDRRLPWRLGLAVSKKTGCAVWRNRTRRLIRECFRLAGAQVPDGYDYVVTPKRGLDPRSLGLEHVRSDILPLLLALTKKRAQGAGTES